MDKQLASIVLCAASGGCLVGALRCIPIRYTRRGAMRFLRVGRFQASWVMCRESI